MRFRRMLVGLLALAGGMSGVLAQAPEPTATAFQWGVKIPLRDGVKLNATLYRPSVQRAPLPCVFTMTPYISQTYHERGRYFSANGYVFLTIDVRGRGNSEGDFTPLLQEVDDVRDVVDWLARQPYCDGKLSMWGGSYAGTNQWLAAKWRSPQLRSIVPVAAPWPGFDFPMNSNIFLSYDMIWLTLTSGHTGQEAIFGDWPFWEAKMTEWSAAHHPFAQLDVDLGNPSPIFQEWLRHPTQDAYWARFVPSPQDFAKIDLPILSITGQYDIGTIGALAFYRAHMREGSAAAKAQHYLVIGPWDHAARARRSRRSVA